jgi:hypothetical protein
MTGTRYQWLSCMYFCLTSLTQIIRSFYTFKTQCVTHILEAFRSSSNKTKTYHKQLQSATTMHERNYVVVHQ